MKSTERKSLSSAVEVTTWTAALTAAWWLSLTTQDTSPDTAIIYSAILSILIGIRSFIWHGHGSITANGLFGLSTSMFVGATAILLLSENSNDINLHFLALATTACLTAQAGTTLLAWGSNPRPNQRLQALPPRAANSLVWSGLLILALALSVHSALGGPATGAVDDTAGITAITDGAAFTSICLISAGLLVREGVKMWSFSTAFIILLLVLYAEVIHTGTGRLWLVALACAVSVIYTARFAHKRIKIGVLLAVPVALAYMAADRLALEETLSAGASSNRTGLESMTATLRFMSQLLEAIQRGTHDYSFGYNMLSVPAIFVPESVWPEQPKALGYELVLLVAPERYGSVYSVVATWTGEAIYNFGWFGIPWVIIFAAIAIRLIDKLLLEIKNRGSLTIVSVLGLVLVAMLAGALADYTWSGVHTYFARTLTRLPAYLAVAAGVLWCSAAARNKANPRKLNNSQRDWSLSSTRNVGNLRSLS